MTSAHCYTRRHPRRKLLGALRQAARRRIAALRAEQRALLAVNTDLCAAGVFAPAAQSLAVLAAIDAELAELALVVFGRPAPTAGDL